MMLDGFFMKFRYRYVERLWGYGFDGPVWRRQFGESYFCNVSSGASHPSSKPTVKIERQVRRKL